MLVLASTTGGSSTWSYILGGAIGAFGVLVLGLITLYFQQRNRNQDRTDAATIQRVSTNQAEISAAFQAWQQVNAANTQQVATLNERLLRAEARADRCEGEVVPALREEVDGLRADLRTATDMVHQLQHRLDQGGGP